MDENLASIHAYLCADGYVIKNPETQKQKYYKIGFRNTNLILLRDFQRKFERVFEIKCSLYEGQRCQKGSKEIYELLTKKFGSFYSWEWTMPKLDENLTKIWLRSYFDCEGWVFCKSHQNRHLGIDCVNEKGLNQIISALNKLGIKTIKKYNKKRKIYRILIYGKENLNRFAEKIGFLHPEKLDKLKRVIEDFVVYDWNFPKDNKKCKEVISNLLKEKIRIKKPYSIRIFSREETNLKNLSNYLRKIYTINSLVNKRVNGVGTVYYELNVNRKEEIKKLIRLKLIPNLFKDEEIK
ncbi:Replication factor C small subunit [uncultured archaeon]|nr:Replication factor C small subunit [uncultured archaeon]